MRYLLPIAAVIALLAPAAASARPLNSDERAALRVATEFWDTAPQCNGSIIYSVEPRSVIGAAGLAWTFGGCNIRIADGMPWLDVCTALTHELGHLLHGPGHTEGIMAARPDPPEACEVADEDRWVVRARRAYRKQRTRCKRRSGVAKRRCMARARRAFLARVADY